MRIILFILTLVFTSAASAGSEYTESQLNQWLSMELKGCKKKPSEAERSRCIDNLMLIYDREIAKAQVRMVEKELAAIKAAQTKTQLSAPAPSAESERISPQASSQSSTQIFIGGAGHTAVTPTRMVSVYSEVVRGVNLHLKNLAGGAHRWAPGESNVRLVILNHGEPCAPHPGSWCSIGVKAGSPSGFETIYVDLNGDGVTERMPVYAVDVQMHYNLYLSWLKDDDIQLVWTVTSGTFERLQVSGSMWQDVPVWKPYPKHCKGRSYLGKGRGMNYELLALHGRMVCQ
jgi:hypothetical protein